MLLNVKTFIFLKVEDTIPLPKLTFIQLFPRSLGNQYLKLTLSYTGSTQ